MNQPRPGSVETKYLIYPMAGGMGHIAVEIPLTGEDHVERMFCGIDIEFSAEKNTPKHGIIVRATGEGITLCPLCEVLSEQAN